MVYSTNIRGYSIKFTNDTVKVLGYEVYKPGYYMGTNEMREAVADDVLRLIREGRIKRLNGLRR